MSSATYQKAILDFYHKGSLVAREIFVLLEKNMTWKTFSYNGV